MKILMIDDMRTGSEWGDITIARDFFTGVRYLQEEEWDLLLLDHDLGPDSVKYKKEWTGYDVMQWLEMNPQYLPGRIQCISANPVGRKRIEVVIDKLYPLETPNEIEMDEMIDQLNDAVGDIIGGIFDKIDDEDGMKIINDFERFKMTLRGALRNVR